MFGGWRRSVVPRLARTELHAGAEPGGDKTARRLDDNNDAAPPAPLLSVVIPVFRNEETLPELVVRLEQLGDVVEGGLQAVFVIDGSPDQSGATLRALLDRGRLDAQLVWHSRNFGSFAAIRSGMAEATGGIIAVMAADLQEPPELMVDFYNALVGGNYDVAIGVRKSRQDGTSTHIASGAFWRLYRRWVQPDMPPGGLDVFACTSRVRDALLGLREANGSLVGLLIWLGFRRTLVPYDRLPRSTGRSGWSFTRKVRYLLDSVYSFTDLPITLLLVIGVSGVFLSLIASLVIFAAWAFGLIRVAGYTPLILTLLVSVSLVLSGLGIVGSYVWRTYENSKLRPNSVVMLREEFARSQASAFTTSEPR